MGETLEGQTTLSQELPKTPTTRNSSKSTRM